MDNAAYIMHSPYIRYFLHQVRPLTRGTNHSYTAYNNWQDPHILNLDVSPMAIIQKTIMLYHLKNVRE